MKEQSKSAVLPALPIVGHLKLTTYDGESLSMIEVSETHEVSELTPFFQKCFHELKAYLSGDSKAIDLPLDGSRRSSFQAQVLRVMREIPFGKLASYKDLAEKLNSKAYQAIGSACGSNPFMLIYPCHRVVGTKDLGGFAHGLKMKKDLLELEGHRF